MENKIILQYRNFFHHDLSIYQSGYEKCVSDHYYGPAKRDCYLLHFIISGKGLYRVRNKEFKLKKGDCFLVIPEEETFYRADKEDPYEFVWVGFRGTNCESFMERLGFYKDNRFVISYISEYEMLKQYFLRITEVGECDMNESRYLQILGTFYTLLSLLEKNGNHIPQVVRLHRENWSAAQEYIAFHYSEAISVEKLAKYLGFHRSNLYKMFKEYSGMSPSEYILNYRLDKALNLVKTTEAKFGNIAYICGFNSLSYFSRAFKNKFGKTPQQIRVMS